MGKSNNVYLGIDIGTANSSIAYVVRDPRCDNNKIIEVRTVQIEVNESNGAKTSRIPTVVSNSSSDEQSPVLGWQVIHRFCKSEDTESLWRHGQNFFRSVKSDIGSFRVYPHAFSDEFNTPEKVMGAVIRFLVDECGKQLPGVDLRTSRVVITVPASLDSEARLQTKEASRIAGLDPDLVELVDEPIAAMVHLLNEPQSSTILDPSALTKILVFDYGGGTLDLSLIRCSYDPSNATGLVAENLAISKYRRNGGDDIDSAVMSEVVWPQIEQAIGVPRQELMPDLRQRIDDTFTSTVARFLKEGICRKVETRLKTNGDWASLKKVKLIHEFPISHSFIDTDLPCELPCKFSITREQFEGVMAPFVAMPQGNPDEWEKNNPHSLIVPILETLARGNIDPGTLDVLVLHGGSCQNPYVKGLLKEALTSRGGILENVKIVQTPDLDASVACGAAIACYWKHARGIEVIPPIIAEDIGIITLGGHAHKLIDAGHSLPYPSETGYYGVVETYRVSDVRQRKLLVPFYRGIDKRIAGVVSIAIPDNSRVGDPIKLRIRVDRDKVLKWQYSIASGQFSDAAPLNDPWTACQLTPEHQRLLEHRRAMRESLLMTGAIPSWMERTEACLLYRVGKLDEAQLLILDCLGAYGDDAESYNLLSLINGFLSNRDNELHYAAKALEMKPQDAVYLGNYGCALVSAGKKDEAIARLRAALGINPELSYVYEALGDLYQRCGEQELAEREFTQSLILIGKQNPLPAKSWTVWRTLSRLYRKLGDYPKSDEAGKNAEVAERNELLGNGPLIAGPKSDIQHRM